MKGVHSDQPPQHTTWIRDKVRPGFGWNVNTSLLRAQGYGYKWKNCWVPKSSYKHSSELQTPIRQNQTPQSHPPTKQTIVYRWVPRIQPSPSATPTTSTKPIEMPAHASTSIREPQSKETKLQVWRPKPLSPKQSPQSTKLSEIQTSDKPTSSLKHQPISKASTSQSTILWRSRLLQALLQHKLTQHMVIRNFMSDTQCVTPFP